MHNTRKKMFSRMILHKRITSLPVNMTFYCISYIEVMLLNIMANYIILDLYILNRNIINSP